MHEFIHPSDDIGDRWSLNLPPLFEESDAASSTVFRDVILLALAGFVAIVLLLLPHINPVGETQETADDPPGNVIVELFWDDERDVDFDLWVRAPGDIPVGYSNRGGLLFNLLRDDLGSYKDPTPVNYEVAYSRGIAAGQYVVNAHLYRFDVESRGAVPMTVVITVVDPDTKVRNQILFTELTMEAEGEERTVFRFTLDKKGRLAGERVDNTTEPLRNGVLK